MSQLFVQAGERAKLCTQNKSGFVLSYSLLVLNFRCYQKSGEEILCFWFYFITDFWQFLVHAYERFTKRRRATEMKGDTHTIAEQLTNICFR